MAGPSATSLPFELCNRVRLPPALIPAKLAEPQRIMICGIVYLTVILSCQQIADEHTKKNDQRLRAVSFGQHQKNQEVLVQLGLAEPLIPNARAASQPKKPSRPDPPPSNVDVVKRTSSRVCGRPATYAEGLTDRDFLAEERAIEYAERRREGSGRASKPVERFEPEDFPRPSKRDRDDERMGTATVKKARSTTMLTVGQPKPRGTDKTPTVAGTGEAANRNRHR